jgi:predicted deacylase
MIPFPDLHTSDFAADGPAARQAFIAALSEVPVTWRETCVHPLRGPQGEELATELAWLGPEDAERVLVVQSGVHGVEGFAGAAAQQDFLRLLTRESLPAGVAVLFIHALNPWGFAWLRRTDERGVDLNRNFVDFSARPLDNPGYAELATAILPRELDPVSVARAEASLASFAAKHGREALELAVTGGQYSHPDGLFYGGRAPSWSRTLLAELAEEQRLARREQVVIVDLHTGLGPFGYGEVICDHPAGSEGVLLARRIFGHSVTEPARGTSSSVPKAGLCDYFWHALLPDRCCFVTLEFGTFPVDAMFSVLRADHALHRAGPFHWSSPETQRIKRAIREHFCPPAQDWQQMVLLRARQVLAQGLCGLAARGAPGR